MNIASVNESPRIARIGELVSAAAAKLSAASMSVPGMRSMPFRFQVNRLLEEQPQIEQGLERLKQRAQGHIGLVDTRPRWGYKHNVEEYARGYSPPGACPVPPRGMALREGTRQYYQPDRQIEGFFIPIMIGGSLLAALGTWAWKHHEEASEVENRVKVYEDLVKGGMDEEEAARLAFGGGSDISGIMSKALLLGALGIGAYILFRAWR